MSRSITRREFAGAASALVAASCSRPAAPVRPNILFVIADDQSFPHAGAYGDRIAQSPHFDRIAREGVVFDRAYSVCPSCTPSRSAVLTGRQIWQTGEGGVLYGTLPSDLPTFPLLLRDAGYHAGWTGKSWGPGDWRAAGRTEHPCGREYNAHKFAPALDAALDQRDPATNFRDFLADRKSPDQPFCFWFGSSEPHRVYSKGSGLRAGKKLGDVRVPPYWPDSPEVRSDILDYYAEIDWFDAQLGRVLRIIEDRGELDRTLIIVTSDNGMPFPRAKVNLYDPGVHMPLAMRWPGGQLPAGRRVSEFVMHIDLAPTILEAAGIASPNGTTGSSLLPLIRTGKPVREFAVAALERHTWCRPDGQTYPIRSFRTARHLYIRNFAPDRWPTGGDYLSSNRTAHGDVDAAPIKEFMTAPAQQKQFSTQYELNFGRRPAEELYDLERDPHEIHNLAADPASIATLAQLRERLNEYLSSTNDPRIRGEDPWQQYPYRQTTGYGASFNSTLPKSERDRAAGRASHKPE